MAKFKVNGNVIVKASNEDGVIISRESKHDSTNKRTEINYLVRLNKGGCDNYKWFKRNELTKPIDETESKKEYVRVYCVPNTDVKITLVAQVDKVFEYYYHDTYEKVKPCYKKVFKLGYSIYNPHDEYNDNVGIKLARHRIKNRPFCTLSAHFLGEFNEGTVTALMDVKAAYIINNIDKFVKH